MISFMVQTCLWPLYLLHMYVCLLLPWSVIWCTLAQLSFWRSLSDTDLVKMRLPHTSCHLAQGMHGLLGGGQEATIDNWTNRSWHQPAEHLKAPYANSCRLCWGGREMFLSSTERQPPMRQLLGRWEHLQYFLLVASAKRRGNYGVIFEKLYTVSPNCPYGKNRLSSREGPRICLFVFLS